MIAAVVFDLDGVIVDSEQLWDEVREQLVADWGGRYSEEAQRAMMGMSSLGVVALHARGAWIAAEPRRDQRGGRAPDARALPRRAAADRRRDRRRPRSRRARSSSRSRRPRTGRSSTPCWRSPGSRPASTPRCRRRRCRAASRAPTSTSRPLDGSTSPPRTAPPWRTRASGIRAASSAGMRVVAVPNRHYPPGVEVLALADAVVRSPAEIAGGVPSATQATG